jgi:hypothetical protein
LFTTTCIKTMNLLRLQFSQEPTTGTPS